MSRQISLHISCVLEPDTFILVSLHLSWTLRIEIEQLLKSTKTELTGCTLVIHVYLDVFDDAVEKVLRETVVLLNQFLHIIDFAHIPCMLIDWRSGQEGSFHLIQTEDVDVIASHVSKDSFFIEWNVVDSALKFRWW